MTDRLWSVQDLVPIVDESKAAQKAENREELPKAPPHCATRYPLGPAIDCDVPDLVDGVWRYSCE
jgi:hypothetical protein